MHVTTQLTIKKGYTDNIHTSSLKFTRTITSYEKPPYPHPHAPARPILPFPNGAIARNRIKYVG